MKKARFFRKTGLVAAMLTLLGSCSGCRMAGYKFRLTSPTGWGVETEITSGALGRPAWCVSPTNAPAAVTNAPTRR
jgi:hypothetical protein